MEIAVSAEAEATTELSAQHIVWLYKHKCFLLR